MRRPVRPCGPTAGDADRARGRLAVPFFVADVGADLHSVSIALKPTDLPMRRLSAPFCRPLPALLLGALSLCVPAHAQTDPDRVYRCPDNSYTNMLSVVHEKHCRPVDNANLSIVAPSAPPHRAAPPHVASGAHVGDKQQSERDAEARQLLESELQAQQERLQEQLKAYAGGQPERLGNERNYQAYLDRVAQMKKGIDLTQANIDALQRQLARYAH